MGEDFAELTPRRPDPPATVGELTDPLLAAAQAYVKSGDADAVLGADVDRAARRLPAAYVGSSAEIPALALAALATVRWCQHTARRGTVAGELARREAIRLYEHVIAEIPAFPLDSVPAEVRALVSEPDPGLRRLRLAHEGAVKLIGAAQAARDRVRLREGIEVLRAALAGTEPAPGLAADGWHTLAQAWQLWSELAGDAAGTGAEGAGDAGALGQAVNAYRRSADGTPPGYERANRYQSAYALLWRQARLNGDEAPDAAAAVATMRAALDALPSPDKCPARWLLAHARDLLRQAGRDRDAGPADEALRVLSDRLPLAADAGELGPDQLLPLIAEIAELKAELAQPAAACDCTPPARERAVALSPDLAYAFGLAVLDIELEALTARAAGPALAGQLLSLDETAFQWDYAAIRAVQAMASPFLNRHALRLLKAALDVIRQARPDADDWPAACARFEDEATRLTRRDDGGLSCADLLESTARLEAYRRFLDGYAVQGQPTTVSLYLAFEAAAYPEPGRPERRGFTYLAERLGQDDAYLLLAPLAFLAFTAEDPVATFGSLASRAAGHAAELSRMGSGELLAWAGLADQYQAGYLDPVAAGETLGTMFITDPLQAALGIWDRPSLLDAFCRPATHLSRLPGDQRAFRHLLPPVIILTTSSGELTMTSNGVAESRPGFAYEVIRSAGLTAAAERLTVRRHAAVEHRCWHQGCPVFATGLCHRWYAVPDQETGHDACGFPREFAALAGVSPALRPDDR